MNENCWRWAEKSSEFDRGLSVVFIASPLTTRPNSIYHDFHILVTAFLIGLAAAAYTHGPLSGELPSRVREIKSDCVIFD